MDTKQTSPKSLLEAVRYFSDLAVCDEYMVNIKYPEGVIYCPKCGATNVGKLTRNVTLASGGKETRMLLQCKNKECRKQFSPKVGTIFEDSPLGLDKWFVAVWSITNAKNGISSCELSRALGVTQKSAWHMLHRIRLAMSTGSFQKTSSVVEADETFIGGKLKNKHRSKKMGKGAGVQGKAIVTGLLERGQDGKASQMQATTIENTHGINAQSMIRDLVEPGSIVMTDSGVGFRSLGHAYIHFMVNHDVEYAKGSIHVNGAENFWSLLKRALMGTYVAVEPFHLAAYVDEQCFRFNNRKETDGQRFARVMMMVKGKRLTYAELTGKTGLTPVS
jgi:transposase-like protein